MNDKPSTQLTSAIQALSLKLTRGRSSDAADSSSWWVDLVMLAIVIGMCFGLSDFALRVTGVTAGPTSRVVDINLSPWHVPAYTLMSLARGFAAYGISLIFALCVGTLAARNRVAERILIPVLDILQAIPVLGFLPGFVIGFIALMPNEQLGLEMASVLMIFTGQVWNMVFAVYSSMRSVPVELHEVARLHRFSKWKIFKTVDLPFSTIPLLWNSMISMAGGWFFLSVSESFRLNDSDYRLPGIGSYMSEAVDEGNILAMGYAIVSMVFMIVATDRLLWRPLIVWAQRFKVEDSVEGSVEDSLVLRLVQRSVLLNAFMTWRRKRKRERESRVVVAEMSPVTKRSAFIAPKLSRALLWLGLAAAGVVGTAKLFHFLTQLTLSEWGEVLVSLLLTFLRVIAALVLILAWTVPVGIVIGRSRSLSRVLQPVVQAIASFPAPMVFPLVGMFLVGHGVNFEFASVFLMMLGAQWYLLFNIISATQSIPGDLLETSKMYGVTGRNLWRTLYLPACFPALVTGLVSAAGGAWNACIVSELVRFKDTTLRAKGIGSLITDATSTGRMDVLIAAIVALSVALVVINRLVWKRLFIVADRRFAMNR